MKKLLFITALSFISSAAINLFAFEKISTQDLFYSYLKNDSDLKNLTIEAEQAQLSLKSTQIENGFLVNLTSGSLILKSNGEDSSLTVKSAGLSASLPQASNLTLTASSDYSVENSDSEKVSEFSDTKLNLSIDIFSSNSITRKVNLMKAQRSFTQAKRALENQAIECEIEFYTSLKELLTATGDIISAQSDLYDDTMDFESIKAKGYSSLSSTYQLANMKVLSDQHEIQSLIHDYILFYKDCGYEIQLDSSTDFYQLLPSDLPQVQGLDINSFDSEKYTEIEEALWTYQINSLSRSANNYFSLSANGGYTFNNSDTSTDTLDAGLSTSIAGLSLSGGVNMPLNGQNPVYTFGASLSPSDFFLKSISDKSNKLTDEAELLAIEDARKNYEKVKTQKEGELEEILWNKESYQESYQMYESLSNQLKEAFDAGLIAESQYLSALSQVKSYKVNLLTNKIDLIIYNNELLTLFVNE
ncbi:MAG: hypothetical protein K5866_09035 [Treponema sp.]|nr:hypothetical protein [Treponema sp.]